MCHTKIETVMNNFEIPSVIPQLIFNDFDLSLKANLEVCKSPKLV